jgi:hypothetical protein
MSVGDGDAKCIRCFEHKVQTEETWGLRSVDVTAISQWILQTSTVRAPTAFCWPIQRPAARLSEQDNELLASIEAQRISGLAESP